MKFMQKPWGTLGSIIGLLTIALCANGCEQISDAQRREQGAPSPTPVNAQRTDPQMQAVLDKLAALNPKPLETLSPEEARRQPTIADAVKALLEERQLDTTPEQVGKVENRQITGAAGQIPARL